VSLSHSQLAGKSLRSLSVARPCSSVVRQPSDYRLWRTKGHLVMLLRTEPQVNNKYKNADVLAGSIVPGCLQLADKGDGKTLSGR